MDLNEMKLKDVLCLAKLLETKADDTAFEIGKAYLIRTVTLYYTGQITRITPKELVLCDAAWIADTGRFNECLKDGKFNEVEPFIESVIVPRDSIIDATIWTHRLPRELK